MGIRLDSYKMIGIIKKLVTNINEGNAYFKAREYDSIHKVINCYFDNSHEKTLKWIASSLKITNYIETVFAEDSILQRVDMHVFKAIVDKTMIYIKVSLRTSEIGISETLVISLHEWKDKIWK